MNTAVYISRSYSKSFVLIELKDRKYRKPSKKWSSKKINLIGEKRCPKMYNHNYGGFDYPSTGSAL